LSGLQVDQEVWLSVALSPWVSRRFLAFPGQTYDAPGEEGAMAKYTITFVQAATLKREDEEVQADFYVDSPPFVDFRQRAGSEIHTVARYRMDDIRRILKS
jgi:hypothetical protein